MKIISRAAAFLLMVFAFYPSILFADTLPNFQKTWPHIWRSGRPQPEALAMLANQGLRTIIDLEDDLEAVAKERVMAEKLGIKHLSYPIFPGAPVNDALVEKVLRKLMRDDPGAFPVLVHCYAGEDRTGMILGLYRIYAEDWSPVDAYREMLELGFHPEWTELDDYFRWKTGMGRFFF